jgi:hypothetical protein
MSETLPSYQNNSHKVEPKMSQARREARQKMFKRRRRFVEIAAASAIGAAATLGIGLAKEEPKKEAKIKSNQKTSKSVSLESNERFGKINADSFLVKNPEFIKKINGKNMDAYKEVAEELNVPWELLAAIHYRESNFSRENLSNGQGPFQIYLMPEKHQKLDRENFEDSCKLAAIVLQEKMGGKLTQDTVDLNLISEAAGLYNGLEQRCVIEAEKNGLQSNQWHEFKAYSWANFNKAHKNMIVQLQDNVPVNLKDKSTHAIDQRYGAVKIFWDLKNAFYNEDSSLNEVQ